jgi:Tfp pilus assembly protein PilF
VEYFRKALTIDPGQAEYHYFLGLALEKDRQQDEALREFRRAVDLGGPPEARLGLARAALESGDPGLAVEELNRLLVASPDNTEAKALLARATGETEARRRLVEGQSQFANQRLVRLEQIVADANRANRELEARLQSVMQEKRLLEKRGSSQEGGTPSTDETVRELERALEKIRLTVRDLALELGRNALRARSWEQARGHFEQAAEADPRSGGAWSGLGEALLQLGQHEKAQQMFKKAKKPD